LSAGLLDQQKLHRREQGGGDILANHGDVDQRITQIHRNAARIVRFA